MSLKDCRGVPVSCDDRELIDALERCQVEANAFRGDPVGDIARVLEDHPDFVMGHCFKAGMLTQSMEPEFMPTCWPASSRRRP